MMKKCAFPHARHIYSLENYFTGGWCRLARRVLTLADENYRGEPREILVKCFKNFVYPWFARRKKKANSERYFKTFYSLVNLWTVLLQPEEKAKLKQPAYRSNEFQFFQQGVGKFIFPSKFKWGSFFCDSRSKIDISETSLKLFLKRVYTSGNIFLFLATAQQTLLILCSVGVSVVLRLNGDVI